MIIIPDGWVSLLWHENDSKADDKHSGPRVVTGLISPVQQVECVSLSDVL